MNIKDKLVSEALATKMTTKAVTPITTPHEVTLTSSDDDVIKGIINNEYIKRGVDPNDLSVMSTTALVTQGLIYLLERTAETLSIQSRESSILTAQKNTTLYNQLIQHTDDIMLSKPSVIDLFIKIPFSEIERHGKKDGPGKYKFTFSTDNTVVLDGKPFIPQFDVEILLTKTNIKEEIKVQYKTSEGYRNIPTQRGRDLSDSYYGVFKVPFSQLTIQKEERTFSGSQIERFVLKTDNPISDFILTYKDSTMSNPILIDAKLYYTRGAENYLKYKLHDNSKISIEYIYTASGFNPRAGGKLSITLLTTTGEDVKFRGNPTVTKRVPDNLIVEYLPVGVEFISSGGKLTSDDKEYIRSYIRQLKGTRLRIDTEADLKTYLNIYSGRSTFNPRLIISDIKSRIFNVYTLMSFENGGNTFTVPTTSGDVLLPLSNLPVKYINGDPMYSIMDLGVESVQTNKEITYRLKDTTKPEDIPEGADLFNYRFPFHLSYNERENYIRCLMSSSYNIPFDTYCTFDSDNVYTPTRFVNTTLRVNDFEKEDGSGKYEFSISTEIRSDSPSFKLGVNNFNAELILTDIRKRNVRVKLTTLVDQQKDSKYTLVFNLNSDRKVYDRYFYLSAEVETLPNVFEPEDNIILDIEQKDVKLNLYARIEEDNTTIKVTTFEADVNIFTDVSKFVYLQSYVTFSGELKLLLCPLVESDFFQFWRNKKNINQELERIFSFINEEIYDNKAEYSKSGFNLRDRQESLFTTSIKFVRTHGRSKFLQLSAKQALTNLQVSPTFNYRLINNQFDLNRISSDTNEFLTKNDFLSTDLHINDMVASSLYKYSTDLDYLQFINFGEQYNDTDHMIVHNDSVYLNEDIPEAISLTPKYDEDLGIYVYDVKYLEI
ncbi:MAG: hypothetical protein ACRCX2_20795 [Paraclostridium sp.]